MIFKMKAEITFEAEDIEDALIELGAHFSSVRNGFKSNLIQSGEIEVAPYEEPAEKAVTRINPSGNRQCSCGYLLTDHAVICASCKRPLLEPKQELYLPESKPSKGAPDTKAWGSQKDGSHYKNMGIQPMEFTMSNNMNPLQHTIIKYTARCYDKHDDPLIDLEKARHCIDMLIDWEKMKQDNDS